MCVSPFIFLVHSHHARRRRPLATGFAATTPSGLGASSNVQ